MTTYWDKETDKYIFFWGGIFSNWFKAPFTSNITATGSLYEFGCTEQYMMACKAHLFEDHETLELILDETDPRKHKDLGKKVKGFKDEIWLPRARSIVYNGCYDKFYQNDKLFSIILSTEDKILVEASPYDKLWGIGLTCADPQALWPNLWLGKNWLGEVLMKVRQDLRDGVEYTFEDIKWKE